MNKNIGSRYYYEKDLVRNVQPVGGGVSYSKRSSTTKFVRLISHSRIKDLSDRQNVRHFEVGFGTRAGVG